MAKNIYVWDDRSAQCWVNGKFMTKSGDGSCALVKANKDTPIDAIVNKIVSHCTDKEIETLRMMAHGTPGELQIGKEFLNATTEPRFGVLKGRFSENGRIEIHACKLAAQNCDPATKICVRPGNWCQTLADRLLVNVMAAEELQWADADWQFEGTVITYVPTLAAREAASRPLSLGKRRK